MPLIIITGVDDDGVDLRFIAERPNWRGATDPPSDRLASTATLRRRQTARRATNVAASECLDTHDLSPLITISVAAVISLVVGLWWITSQRDKECHSAGHRRS